MSEAKVLAETRIKASKLGSRLFRNQVGSYELKDGTVIRSGMGKGSSDLIGWHPVKITQDMVGKTLAVFTAIECKFGKGQLSAEQTHFINVVRQAGGIAGTCWDADQLEVILNDES